MFPAARTGSEAPPTGAGDGQARDLSDALDKGVAPVPAGFQEFLRCAENVGPASVRGDAGNPQPCALGVLKLAYSIVVLWSGDSTDHLAS